MGGVEILVPQHCCVSPWTWWEGKAGRQWQTGQEPTVSEHTLATPIELYNTVGLSYSSEYR